MLGQSILVLGRRQWQSTSDNIAEKTAWTWLLPEVNADSKAQNKQTKTSLGLLYVQFSGLDPEKQVIFLLLTAGKRNHTESAVFSIPNSSYNFYLWKN